MTDPRDLALLWEELEAEAPAAAGLLVRRVAPESRWDFWLALLAPDHRRCALMALTSAVFPQSGALPVCRGIDLRESPAPKGLGGGSRALELRLENHAYSTLYDHVLADLIEAAEAEDAEQTALNAVISRLSIWQTFLERAQAEGLSPEAQRGLYGELLFLRDHVIPVTGAATGLRAWCGPARKPQDFQLGEWAAEVKVSIAKQPQAMRIASELQLDDSGLKDLFLAQFALSELTDGGETLPGIVRKIRRVAAQSGVAGVFEDLLLQAGYHDLHEERYAEIGYQVRSTSLFRIADGFPRIMESDLRPGVGQVTYSIGVADCASFNVAPAELRRALEGMQ